MVHSFSFFMAPITYFKLIFVHNVRCWSRFFFPALGRSRPGLPKAILPLWSSLAFLSHINSPPCVDLPLFLFSLNPRWPWRRACCLWDSRKRQQRLVLRYIPFPSKDGYLRSKLCLRTWYGPALQTGPYTSQFDYKHQWYWQRHFPFTKHVQLSYWMWSSRILSPKAVRSPRSGIQSSQPPTWSTLSGYGWAGQSWRWGLYFAGPCIPSQDPHHLRHTLSVR